MNITEHMHKFITYDEIKERLIILADSLKAEYRGDDELVAICVLKGALHFYSDLLRLLEQLPIICSFITLSSYGDNMESSGEVLLAEDLSESIEGKRVLIVEDIVDTGLTLEFLRGHIKKSGAKDIKTVCLIDKPNSRKVEVSADFVAFRVETDEFLVGYGLDYVQHLRNLNDIYKVKKSDLTL